MRQTQKLGGDPSYVSPVAIGKRTSKPISEALRAEIQQTWAMANVASANDFSAQVHLQKTSDLC